MTRAYASTVIDAPADEVWAHVRDFNGLPNWHPGIGDSHIEEGKAADSVGCVRNFNLKDGTNIRERLLSLSDADRHYSYNFETWPFPVRNYHATLRVVPVTDGDRAFVEWWTTFDCDEAREAEMVETFAGAVFQGGFDALKRHFSGRGRG